jgi:zinc/manganese transport system substrate-binding protein
MILIRFGVVSMVTVFTLAACSDGSDDLATADPSADGPVVVATTSIWADITSQVFCGEQVDAVIPVGADPHTFEPSLRDRERLDDADLVVANGGGLEDRLSDLLDTVATDGVNLVEMTPHIDVIATDDDHDGEAETEEHDEDEHGHGIAADPHVWQDPTRVAGALDVIASAGTAIGLDGCNEEFAAELADLDAEITVLLADIPPAQRIMVTSHDSLAYFADRYDLEIVGTVIPSTNTLAQTNAADLADLADLIEERGVPAIFTEALESTADADALADRLGVEVVPLVTDALTDDPETDTYAEMMRSNAAKIAAALTP